MAVFLALVVAGVSPIAPSAETMVAWGANYGPRTLAGQPWRFFTSLFLHYGVIHLLFNMAVLWQGGRLTERLFGHLEIATLYLAAGLCGGLASLLVHPQVSSAGASGAVFGVFGALGALLLRQRDSMPPVVLDRLKRMALSFLGYNLVYGFMLSNVDVAAHVGGLLGGAAAGALLARPLVVGRAVIPRRVGLVAALSLAVVALSYLLPPPGDLQETLKRFAQEETRIIADYEALVDGVRYEHQADRQLAADIRQRVIKPWHAMREQLAAHALWSSSQKKAMTLLVAYMDAREEAWAWTASAVGFPPGPDRQSHQRQAESMAAIARQRLEELKNRKP